MDICKKGYLDAFVTPTGEGGWGLPTWIVSIMLENRAYSTFEVYTAIQDSGLDASIKALSKEQITQILTWMSGKEFNGVTIGLPRNETITYTQPE